MSGAVQTYAAPIAFYRGAVGSRTEFMPMRQQQLSCVSEVEAANIDTASCQHCGGLLFRLLSVESYVSRVDTYTFSCRACDQHVQINLPNDAGLVLH